MAKSGLSPPFSLLGREPEPHGSLYGILRHAAAQKVHSAETGLSGRVALFSGKAEPVYRPNVILRQAETALVHPAQVSLTKRLVSRDEPLAVNKCRRIIAAFERSCG